MARVVKKEKKDKKDKSNKKTAILISSIVGGVAVIGLTVFLVIYLLATATPRLYANAKDISYEELVELNTDASVRSEYAGTIYVLVFNSDIEQYPDYELTNEANAQTKDLISSENKLAKHYSTAKVEMSKRTAFYVVDLMDSDNEDILIDETFGSTDGKSYLITITNDSSYTVKTSSASTSLIREINTDIKAILSKYE